jgi:inhibitor of KinA sporulation pathway (predicted exonuclease)
MEWNQAMSAKSSVFYHLPIHLRGEIIQIGAVKLNDDWTPGEEFQLDVKPVYFRKMHYKVKKLTGIDADRLSDAPGFVEAFAQFRAFCGEDCTFLTWGYDDKGILEQNIIIHDLDWDWIAGWVNLQLIYNVQTGGGRNQKALSTAMEFFQIEQTRVAHDALGDAYNTALVCSRLDMAAGLANYANAERELSMRSEKTPVEGSGPAPLEYLSFPGYASRSAAFADETVTAVKCPVCGGALTTQRWVNQGDRRYMNLAECPEHGKFLVRVKLHRTEEETWTANRMLYEADEAMTEYYATKSTQKRRRSRSRRRSRKKKPVET